MAVCYGRELKEFSKAARCDGLLLFVVETVGLEPPVGFLIVWHARGQGFDDEPAQLVVALRGYQRALVASAQQTFVQTVDVYVEQHGGAVGVHPLHIVEKAWSASSAGYYHILKLACLMKHGLLAQAESLLSVAVEQFAHCGMVAALDIVVEIDKPQAGDGGKMAPYGRLAAPHVSDKKYRLHTANLHKKTEILNSLIAVFTGNVSKFVGQKYIHFTMDLFEKVNADIKSAMLARDHARLEALRGIKKEFLEAKTAKGSDGTLTDETATKVLVKMVKQRKESAEIYTQQSRPELAQEELAQAAVIEEYLPKQLSDEELTAELKKIIEQTGATSAKEMGKVMGVASKALAGRADGRAISAKVKELLA